MISPADALNLTLQSQAAGAQQILESTEFDITSWTAKHIPPAFTVSFASLGAEDFEDLRELTEPDLEKIQMPPLKRRRILRQIEKDMVTYGFGKPSNEYHIRSSLHSLALLDLMLVWLRADAFAPHFALFLPFWFGSFA
jgi:hypothetical protein